MAETCRSAMSESNSRCFSASLGDACPCVEDKVCRPGARLYLSPPAADGAIEGLGNCDAFEVIVQV